MGAANHTRRAHATPKQSTADIFSQIASAERSEFGDSYSGTFGSKDGVRSFKVNLTKRQFAVLEGLIWDLAFNGNVITKAQSIERRTVETIGINNLKFFAEVADDKWGPALGLRNKNGDIIFMGMCSE